MKLHIGKSRAAKTAITLLLVILMIFGAVFGVLGLNFGKNLSASAKINGTTDGIINLDNENYNATTDANGNYNAVKKNAFNKAGIKSLIEKIGTAANISGGASSYAALNKGFATDGAVDATIAATVKLGGMNWNVVYVSRKNGTAGKDDDIIVTLWLADNTKATAGVDTSGTDKLTNAADPTSTVNQNNYFYSAGGWSYNTQNLKLGNIAYPTNMYSSSFIRAQLNGTNYAYYGQNLEINTNVSTTVKEIKDGTNVQKTVWKNFINKYTDYIAVPNDISWQYEQHENIANSTGHTWSVWGGDAPNSGIHVTSSSTFYNGNKAYQSNETLNYSTFGDASNGTDYSAWGNDKLWLPSLWETGYDTTHIGLWNTTDNQRKATSTDPDPGWLRSGSNNYAYGAYILYSSTGGLNCSNVSNRYSARPALHLNLKSAASAAGVELPKAVETAPAYSGGMVKILENIDENIAIASASVVQTDRSGSQNSKTVTLTPDDYEIKDGGFYATLAGAYTIEFKLKTDVTDLPVWDRVTYYDGYPARVISQDAEGNPTEYGDVLFWEIPPDSAGGSTQPTYNIANKEIAGTVERATPSGISNVQRVTEGTIYTGGELPELTCSYGDIAGTVALDEGQALHHDTKSYNWTFYPADSYNYNDELKGTINLTVTEPQLKDMTATFNVSDYRNAVEAGTAKRAYTSTNLKDLKTIITPFITITNAIKQDNTAFEDIDAILAGFTLSFVDESQTKLKGDNADTDGADNALNLSFGGVTKHINGAVPAYIVDLDGIAIATRPSKTTYTALEKLNRTAMVVTATYTDGTSQTITDYKEIYGDGTRNAFWAGDKTLTITYTEKNDLERSFTKTTVLDRLTVNKIQFAPADVSLASTASKPYTGKPQSVDLGAVPEGIAVTYMFEYGNQTYQQEDVINVLPNDGSYKVTVYFAVEECDAGNNYAIVGDPVKTAYLKITPITYEGVENIKFVDGSAQYSASTKKDALKVSGLPAVTEPDFINVEYKYYSDEACTNELDADTQVVNMGEYWVRAIFAVDTNHNAIAPITVKLTIVAHTITEKEISGVEDEYIYKGEAWKPEPIVTVTLGGVATVLSAGEDKDYTVAYSTEDYVAGTKVVVTVSGKGNFTGEVEIEFEIVKATLKLTWAGDGHDGCVYNGSAHYATITVDADSVIEGDRGTITTEALAAFIKTNEDLVTKWCYISYRPVSDGNSSVIAAGTYKPTFVCDFDDENIGAPWNNYEWKFTNGDFTFEVAEAVLPEIIFENDTVTYDGEKHYLYISIGGVKTEETLLYNGEIEVKYYSSGLNNAFEGRVNASATAYEVRVEITRKTNNYHFPEGIEDAGFTVSENGKTATGYAELTILPRAIGEDGAAKEGVTLSGIEAAYDYCGTEITPKIALEVVLVEGDEAKKLAATTDYTVDYGDSDRLNASQGDAVVTVTVSGTGNYTGSIVKTFKINPISLSLKWIGTTDHDDAHYVYTGLSQGVTAEFGGVAERDKTTVVPDIYYIKYEEFAAGNYTTIDMPKDAGRYVVAVHLTDENRGVNYKPFADEYEFFVIKPASPKVDTPSFVKYNGTDDLFVGQHLPEITKSRAYLNATVTDVAGTVSWKLVDGAEPVLQINPAEYIWVFTPEDTNNFLAVEGTIRLEAKEPTFASMTVKWNTEDGGQPLLWSSNTLDDLRKYITVTATLTNGADFGEVTEQYSLSGSWGEAESPKLAKWDEDRNWNVTVTLTGADDYTFENVKYNFVRLDYLDLADEDYKKDYNALEEFDKDSVTVVAHFTDGTENTITDFSVKYLQEADNRLWYGNRSVTLSYTYRGTTKTATVNGLNVKKITFRTTDIVFESDSVSISYDGEPHSLTLENEDKFDIGNITYIYSKDNGEGGWDVLEDVSGVTDAGNYSVEAQFTIVDDLSLGKGVYTNNYTVDYASKIVYLTIAQIKYAGADIKFADTTAVYNGDIEKLYAEDIKKKATGGTDGIWEIIRFEYRASASGTTGAALSASEAVHAGSYIVTVIFDTDDNHEAIDPQRINLTVEQATPVLKPQLNEHPLKDMPISTIELLNGEGGTAGYFTWVEYGNFKPETYVLHTGANNAYYTFTPDNTVDYKTVTNVLFVITAKNNYPLYMYASVVQGDTELFTSYTLERLLNVAADESEHLTISVYMVYNDGTREEIKNYDVALASGNEYLDRDENGRCYLVFTYEIEGETFEFTEAYVTVHTNGLGSIEAIFVQNGVEIFTSDDIDTIYGLLADEESGVSLTVNSYYADGDFKAELTADEYTLSGDWSGLTADGNYDVTVTASVNGETASNTFKIDVTLVILTEITADFDQKGKSVYASDGITVLENMISGEEVKLTVTAHYNDKSENVLSFGANGYTVSIDTALFEVGKTAVTVLYGEGGINKDATFDVEVTAVLVVGLYAKITAVSQIIYTDTALDDVAKLLSVTAYYNDGTEKEEISDYSLIMPDGGEKLTAGTQVAVNVNYTGEDIADYFEAYMLVLGVVKHNTDITFSGKTVYTYDGAAHDINDGAATNHADDESLTYEIDGAAARIMGAKEYTLVITSAETEDYYPATLTVTITVNKADYDMSDIKLESNTVVYDGTKHYLLVSGSLPMNVYVSGYSYVYGEDEKCEEPSATNAGVYTVTVTFGALNTGDYNEIPDMTAMLTIEKAEVEIDDSGMFATAYTYAGVEQTVTGAKIIKADDGAEIVYLNNTFTGVPAGGKLAVQITVEEGANYKAFDKTVEISVKKAALTITALDNEITYGETPADGGINCEGFVNEETIEDLAGELAYAFDYSQYGNVGEYVIVISGVSSENYEITFVAGKLTVNQAEAEVIWNAQNCVYDGKAHNPTATFTDLFGTAIALTVSLTYANGGYVSEAVGAGDYVASAASLNPNYKLTGTTCEFTIIADTDDWIRFDFRKDYTATYGSVPETAEELAALAELLINQSYVRVDYNVGGAISDLDTVISLMTVRLETNGNAPVTGKTPVGRYNICFEFKPEYAEVYATYTVYQTYADSRNTNLGRLVIQPRELTLEWDATEFKFDGNAHLLTATVAGFIDKETPVTFTMTEKGGEFSFEIDGTTVKFALAISGDFTSVGGHTVTASVDDANYTISNPFVTASIGKGPEEITMLSKIAIGAAILFFVIMMIAIIVAARRKPKSNSGGGSYDEDGFSDLYYGE